MKNWPLKRQFAVAFALVVLLGALATIATYFLAFRIYAQLEYKRIYPANYDERRIPAIEAYIRKEGTNLLDVERGDALANVVPGPGIAYQVVDGRANVLYGTEDGELIANREQLYEHMNLTFSREGQYVKVVPIIARDGQIKGGVLLSYRLSPAFGSARDKLWIVPLFILLLLSPFLYIVLFTLLMSRLLAETITRPLRMLTAAARKIREKDLNFTVAYRASNELGQLSEAFHDMKTELERSLLNQWRMEQDRLEMVENLAHDIKTPLTIIQGYADRLLDMEADDRDKWMKDLTVIKENAVRGSQFVQRMQLAVDSATVPASIRREPVNLPGFLEKKADEYRLLSARKEISVLLEAGDARSEATDRLLDADVLERILDNIVLNAIRYTPSGGTIAIHAEIRGSRLFFRICDSGAGFRSEELPAIFAKLYQGRDSAHFGQEGHAGLGLYIAKQLAERHGGSIRAYNAERGGACVEFDIACGASG